MNPEEFHEDVGSASFQFCHWRAGSRTRFTFNIKVGDNPDFWKARLLMPGAQFCGVIGAVFETDDGAIRAPDGYRSYYTFLTAGNTRFDIHLMARSQSEFEAMCREIGALEIQPGDVSRWRRMKCILRWFWERRPVVRWRSPLDVFDV